MKRKSMRIGGIVSSLMLEDEFWDELRDLAEAKELTVPEFVNIIARGNPDNNLASQLRMEILAAKNREIANLRKMIGAVSKMALDGVMPQPAQRKRAAR